MKSVITLLALATVASGAVAPVKPFTFQRRIYAAQPGLSGSASSNVGRSAFAQSAFSGRTASSGNGQYSPDNSGAYNAQPSSSAQSEGQYAPDNSGEYNGQGLKVVRYGSDEGQYASDNSGSYNPSSPTYPSRYAPRNEGQYYSNDNSGAYVAADGQYYHDDSGTYIHDPSGEYIHIHNPYEHLDNPYVHKGGEYVHPRNYVSIPPAGGYGPPVALKRGNAAGFYDNRNYKIIRKIEHVGEDLYDYLYETENGIYAEEDGKIGNKGTKEEAIRAKGYYTYTGPDSIIYTVNYTADENGFVPDADHIPTPPPVPEAIARSLAYQKSIGEL